MTVSNYLLNLNYDFSLYVLSFEVDDYPAIFIKNMIVKKEVRCVIILWFASL